MMMIYIAAYLVTMNVLTFWTFRADKARAILGDWRVSEKILLMLALSGGWLGAKLAQRMFRHKTRKQPFRSLLNMIPVVWCGFAVLALTLPPVSEMNWPEYKRLSFSDVTQRPPPKFFKSVSH